MQVDDEDVKEQMLGIRKRIYINVYPPIWLHAVVHPLVHPGSG